MINLLGVEEFYEDDPIVQIDIVERLVKCKIIRILPDGQLVPVVPVFPEPEARDSRITMQKAPLEIIEASYWTHRTRLDITNDWKAKVVNNKLAILVSNDIKGDPDTGVAKNLSITYKLGPLLFNKNFLKKMIIFLYKLNATNEFSFNCVFIHIKQLFKISMRFFKAFINVL